ncbi:MAG: winged helix-turn-helix domain-containing protein [Bryobacteraceae bacterium]
MAVMRTTGGLGTCRFDGYEIDLESGRLYKRGVRIHLREKSLQALVLLLEHAGRVVTRDELYQRLWPRHVFVDFDNNLNTVIARVREALHDSAEHPRYIETLPRRGYRFMARVSGPPHASEPEPVQPRARMLVLPFANLSGDPEREYIADAITEEIIGALALLAPQRLAVLARTTAMHYKGTRKDIGEIGRELGVDYVVEGSARCADDRIVISAQLIQAADATHLWGNRYDSELRDVFKIGSVVAQAAAAELGIGSRRAVTRPTEDIEAYNLFLQGRYSYEKGNPPESFFKAKHCFEQAVRLDPEFALAYDSLAEIYWHIGFHGLMTPKEALSSGIFHVLRAIEIDNALAEAHALLGQYRKQLDFNWPEVRREMNMALKLNPVSPIVRQRYAATGLMPHGRIEEAIRELEGALEVDPISTMGRFWLGTMLWLGRQYDRAIQHGRFMLELDAGQYLGYYLIGVCCAAKGLFHEAVAALRRATELSGGSPVPTGMLGRVLAESRNETEARVILERLRSTERTRYVPPTTLAWIHLALGETDSFFACMDRAFDVRDHMLMPIKTYPFLDGIRGDPRYRQLLRRMNLKP